VLVGSAEVAETPAFQYHHLVRATTPSTVESWASPGHLHQETVPQPARTGKQRRGGFPRGLPALGSQPAGACARRGGLRQCGMDYPLQSPLPQHRALTLICSLSQFITGFNGGFITAVFCVAGNKPA